MKAASCSGGNSIPAEKQILICSPNWMGDTVMALPACGELLRRRPGLRISVLARPSAVPIWKMHGRVDDIHVLRGFFSDFLSLVPAIRSRRFPAVCVLPHSARAALLPFLARVPMRSGVKGYHRGILINRPVAAPASPGRRHQVFEYLSVVGIDAIENLDSLAKPHLAAPPATARACGDLLAARGMSVDPEKPLVGLIPGAARGPSKRWPAESFAALAGDLVRRGRRVVLFGTAGEKELCARVKAGSGGQALDLSGETNIEQLVAFLGLCSVVAANDSGGMHLAAAAGAGVVGIFGQTDPERTGPICRRQVIVQAEGGRRDRRIAAVSEEAQASLARMGVDRVVTAVEELLQGQG